MDCEAVTRCPTQRLNFVAFTTIYRECSKILKIQDFSSIGFPLPKPYFPLHKRVSGWSRKVQNTLMEIMNGPNSAVVVVRL